VAESDLNIWGIDTYVVHRYVDPSNQSRTSENNCSVLQVSFLPSLSRLDDFVEVSSAVLADKWLKVARREGEWRLFHRF